MKKAIYIEGNRNGYGPDQCESRTMTIGELIDELRSQAEEWGYDSKVFLRNDNGYTYGSVECYDITHGAYDDHGAYVGDDAVYEAMVNWQGEGWYRLMDGEPKWYDDADDLSTAVWRIGMWDDGDTIPQAEFMGYGEVPVS